MFFLSGVCGMRTEAQNAGSANGNFFIRPGDPGASGRIGAFSTPDAPRSPGAPTIPGTTGFSGRPGSDPRRGLGDAPGPQLFHSDSDDRFEVAFLGELYDNTTAKNPASRILHELRTIRLETGANPSPDAPAHIPQLLPDSFLNRLDGIFIAIIHDRRRQSAHFITDRLGLRYLYFHRQKGRLWFATETKTFLSCPGFSPEISKDALDDFLRYDFIRGDKALLGGVELMPAGTVRSYDFREDRITDHRYWNWEDRRTDHRLSGPDKGSSSRVGESGRSTPNSTGRPVALDEIAEHLATLFRDAVLRRLPDGANTQTDRDSPHPGSIHPGITHRGSSGKSSAAFPGSLPPATSLPPGLGLSGGLDSRAILAALPDPASAYLFTFGRRDSLDVTLARQVSRMAGTRCDFIEINADNWLAPRLEAVWWTDGHANILHMHGLEALDTVASNASVHLNGGVQNFIRGAMAADAGSYQFDRLRRFQRLGTLIDDRRLPSRLPFYDYPLLDFLQTLPDALLRDDRLYQIMLLDHFPRFFRGVPYANTGYALDARFRSLRSFAFRARRRLGLVNYALHDYPRWIRRQIPAFRSFLNSKSTRINDLGFRVDVDRLLDRAHHLSLPECEALCRFLTLEIYLRCLDNPSAPEHVYKYK